MNWENTLEHIELSDVGLRRANNQDSYAVMVASSPEYWRLRGHLFMVADGMGAHAAGELASKLAAETLPHIYSKLIDQPPPSAIVQAVKEANLQIHNRGQMNADFEGMGTTTSVLILLPQGAMVAHVGDSRVYRLRDHQFEQLSFDHSLVWELTARGKMAEAGIVGKNIITRSLGPSPDVAVDLEGPFPVQVGDTFLLCSDGLSGQVTDDEIGAILGTLSPKEAARTLVDLANLRGGPDNITLIIVRVGGPEIAGPQGEPLPPPEFAAPAGKRKNVGPGGWVLLGALGFVTLLLLIGGKLLLAAVSVIALAVAFAVVFRDKLFGDSGGWDAPAGMLGRGPHRSYSCPIDHSFTVKMSKVAQELRDAATTEDWAIDWFAFNAHCERATQATAKHDYHTAAREYCLAISFMMNELRNQRKRKGQKKS